MTVVLRVDCVGKYYGDRRVLTSATLQAVAGEVTGLLGRNGCGKSTLLRIAAGDLRANSGSVSYLGRIVEAHQWHRLARRGFAYLPDRELLSPYRTVRQQLSSVVRQFDLPGYELAVSRCDLEALLDRWVAEISTGELRRAEVGCLVARRPECLLADEPYRNLDPADRAIIGAALRELAADGCAVVITGHEVEEILLSVDRVIWCTDGTTYDLGTPRASLGHWRFVRDYVGEARAERLLTELPDSPQAV